MTSAIIYSTIDESYPIAGQDNNSQGFRDNFNLIKDGLATASSEITALQTNTAKTNDDNDFNGVMIENAEVRRLYASASNLGTLSINTNINTAEADFFYCVLDGNITIGFTGWPASGLYRKITLHVKKGSTGQQINFGGGAIRKNHSTLNTSNLSNTDESYMFEISSYNNGVEIFVNLLAGTTDKFL